MQYYDQKKGRGTWEDAFDAAQFKDTVKNRYMYDVLFVGCYTEGLDPVNKGDYMYRDVFLKLFRPQYRVAATHQARIESAEALIRRSRRVVFGGGGLLYNSLDRDYGRAELKLLAKWYEILARTQTAYGFISIGFQPKDPYKEGMSAETMDGGIFNIVKPFIEGASFICARSEADRLLFSKWNHFTYYYPDLAFVLKRIGLARGMQPQHRQYLLTIGVTRDFNANILGQIRNLSLTHTHYHAVVSKGDHTNSDYSVFLPSTPEIVNPLNLYDMDPYFAEAEYVFTTRFHGMIMAKLNCVPHVTTLLGQWKVKTFEDTEDPETKAMTHLWHVHRFLKN